MTAYSGDSKVPATGWHSHSGDLVYCEIYCRPGHKHSQCGCAASHAATSREDIPKPLADALCDLFWRAVPYGETDGSSDRRRPLACLPHSATTTGSICCSRPCGGRLVSTVEQALEAMPDPCFHTWDEIIADDLARTVIVGNERLPDRLRCRVHGGDLDAPILPDTDDYHWTPTEETA